MMTMNENNGNANGGENVKGGKVVKRSPVKVGFIRLKNNLFQASEIKNLRLDGRSIRVFMTESLYARVEYDDEVKAREIFEGVCKRLLPSVSEGGWAYREGAYPAPSAYPTPSLKGRAIVGGEREVGVHDAEGEGKVGLVERLKKAWQR